jgi:hypothetical protein
MLHQHPKFKFPFSTSFYITESDYNEKEGGSSDRPVLDYGESGNTGHCRTEILASLALLLPPIV